MFTILYTHQKTKKNKTWQDGTLQRISKTKLNLFCDKGRFLDSVYNSTDVTVGDEIESDRYLVTIEGPAPPSANKENTYPQLSLLRPPAPPPQAKICPRFEKPGSKVGKKFVPPINKNSYTTPEREAYSIPEQPAASSLFTSFSNKRTNIAGVNNFAPQRFEPSPFQPSQNFKAFLEADSQQFQDSPRPDKPVYSQPDEAKKKFEDSAPPPTQKRTLEDIFAVFERKLDLLSQPSLPTTVINRAQQPGQSFNQLQATSRDNEQPTIYDRSVPDPSQHNASLSQRMDHLQTLIENNKSNTLEHSSITSSSTFDIDDMFSPEEPQTTACKTGDRSVNCSAPSSVSSDGLSSYINNMIDDLPSQTLQTTTPDLYSTNNPSEPPPGYLSHQSTTIGVNRSFSDNIMSCLDDEDLEFEETFVEEEEIKRGTGDLLVPALSNMKGNIEHKTSGNIMPCMNDEDLAFEETFVEEDRKEVKEVKEEVNWWDGLEEEVELEEDEEVVNGEEGVIHPVQGCISISVNAGEFMSQKQKIDGNSAQFETIDYFNMFEIEENEVEMFSPVAPNTQSDECTNSVDVPHTLPGYLSESYSPNMHSTVKRSVEVEDGIDNKRRRFEKPSRARDVEVTRVFKPAETKPKTFSSPFLLGCDMRLNKSSSTQKLLFAKREEIIMQRQISIPSTFSNAAQYRDCMLSVIYEHLNVSIGVVAEKYYNIPLPSSDEQGPSCPHGKAKLCSVNKPGPNKGRSFYSCRQREGGCKLFEWVSSSEVPCLRTPAEYHQYYSSRGVSYYSECSLERKAQSNLYLLKLSVQDKHTAYNKDDVWFVCPQKTSISSHGCLMQSTFYGPNSRGCIELRVLGDTIPGCSVKVHCIQVLKNCAELEILSSIEGKLSSLPLVPALLEKRASGEQLQFSVEAPLAIAERLCHKYGLNEGQHEAVLALLNSLQRGPPILLVHGVFGSGKSYLLAVIVLILVEVLHSNERAVISSTTNVAVDNVLVRLLDFGFTEFLRVGSMKKINKRIAPYVLQQQESVECHYSVRQQQNEEILNRVQVVGTTCASSLSITNHSIVLLDESSQITEPSSLLPLLQAGCKRLVLVGDPMQLPPTIESHSVTQSGLEQTLFDRAEAMGYPSVMLSEQYRCHPVISSLSNTLFYKGALRDGVSSEDRPALVPLQPLVFISTEGAESHSGESYCNNKEAATVVELVRLLEKQGITKEQVAVITLYRGQEALLKKSLGNSRTLKVSTVDAIQGAERDIVILSCVRTSKIGFGDCPRRVNVALSRAKHHLIILGNLSMLSTNPLWGNIVQICADRKSVMTQDEVFTALRNNQ